MAGSFATRFAVVRSRYGPLALGLDPSGPVLDAWGIGDSPDGVDRFADTALEAAAGTVGLVKLQAAFYERHGWQGFRTLQRLISAARSAGLLVIVDAKRGDVGTTNDAYAEAYLGADAPLGADALTVHPYLGVGAMGTLVSRAQQAGSCLLVVTRSSNPEGRDIQSAAAPSGRTVEQDLIERGPVDGTCVNTGCVPSKALLAAAAARHDAASQLFPGIATQAGPVGMPALTGGKDELVAAMRASKYADLAADYGWEIIAGTARFAGGADAPVLDIVRGDGGTTTVEAGQYLVATGTAPWIPPVSGLAGAGYLTSTTAMELTELPESLLVIGGNAVGLELAQMFARLGAQVTIAEALDRLAPFGEPEVSAAIEDVFDDEGIGILTAATVTSVRGSATGRSAKIGTAGGQDRELAYGQILVAAGRRPVTGGLGLDAAGVKIGGRGEVVTDESGRTANPRIWAAGDVTGGPQFVYVAAAQGSATAANALFGRRVVLAQAVRVLRQEPGSAGRAVDYATLPRVTFTSPAIASAGLTEAELVRAGVACDCRVLPASAVPRAIVARDICGVFKLVAEAGTGRVRGVHAVAAGAGEMITAASYAIRAGMTVTDLAQAWAPYLTMSEGLRLAAQAFTRDVSRLSCCAA